MSTRSNIILVTPDNKVHQFYHHWDGYLSGVGEDLRKHLIYSVGMSVLAKDLSVYDILVGELAGDDDYRDERVMSLDTHNELHGDIEYTYVIKDNKLFYVYKYNLCNDVDTYKDLIDYVCKDKNELALDKPIHNDNN